MAEVRQQHIVIAACHTGPWSPWSAWKQGLISCFIFKDKMQYLLLPICKLSDTPENLVWHFTVKKSKAFQVLRARDILLQDLVQIDHPRFYTWAAPCCFKPPVRREGNRIVTRFQLQDDMENDLCSDDPWLILHKIDSPTKMRYLGSRVGVSIFSI